MEIREEDCRFTSVKMTRCEECNNDHLMHEFGKVLKTQQKVKQCLCCGKITIVK